jgi:TetR/AcrR family transcriptional regulator
MFGPEPTHEPSPHVRAKRERRRAEILRAALAAFRDHGYHATTLDDIAAGLGVRKTALYHYFPDKQSILLACHRDAIADLERILAAARPLSTAELRLRHVVREHVRVMTDALGGSPLAFEVTSLAPEQQTEIIAARDRYERELREIVALGMRQGTFRRGDPKLAVFILLGALNGIARWYRPGGAWDAAALGEAFAGQLVGGLLRDGAEPAARSAAPARTRRSPATSVRQASHRASAAPRRAGASPRAAARDRKGVPS